MYWTDDDAHGELYGSNAASSNGETYSIMAVTNRDKTEFKAYLGEREIATTTDIDTAKLACERHEAGLC